MNEEISGRINQLKGNIQTLWQKISDNDFELARGKVSEIKEFVHDKVSNLRHKDESAEVVSVPGTEALEEDDGGGVRYYSTENNPMAIDAKKVEAGKAGIDRFGEESEFTPDEADDNQTLTKRNQNSDLAQRYYAPGLDLNDV